MAFIPYGRQSISEEDIKAVADVLRSDFLTQGPAVPAFEEAVKARCGASHAVAANSATSALHLACLALDIGPGDMVWTSPITFVASANCALFCGADIDFVDIDPVTFNMSAVALEEKLERVRKAGGKLPKAVIPVHMAGQSCEMAELHGLAQRYGFRLIEDASHAIGGRYRGEPVGSCRHSDIAVFSFHPVKIITTGEGGMAVTNDAALARKMALLRSHGVTREASDMDGVAEGGWYYQQIALGFNYRMTDIQAALGLSQLRRLESWVARRNELATRYDQELSRLRLLPPGRHPDALSSWHLYSVQVKNGVAGGRNQLYAALREDGIGVNVHYIPVHLQPFYGRRGFKPGDFPKAEAYYAAALTIPLYAGMSDSEQEFVIARLARHCGRD
jgi:UDP-4-amino-4,6-dideoxy-N-acetyl-beta-L-altrosamine transaminase